MKKSINSLVGKYLIHSYLYYICGRPVISDSEFDDICRLLLDFWDDIEHMHKHLITQADLKAGTGYTLKDSDYPTIVKSVAAGLVSGVYK